MTPAQRGGAPTYGRWMWPEQWVIAIATAAGSTTARGNFYCPRPVGGLSSTFENLAIQQQGWSFEPPPFDHPHFLLRFSKVELPSGSKKCPERWVELLLWRSHSSTDRSIPTVKSYGQVKFWRDVFSVITIYKIYPGCKKYKHFKNGSNLHLLTSVSYSFNWIDYSEPLIYALVFPLILLLDHDPTHGPMDPDQWPLTTEQ